MAARLVLFVFVTGSSAVVGSSAEQHTKHSPNLKRVTKPVEKVKPAQKAKSAQKALTRKDIREAEQILSDLGYWTGPVDGRMDEGSRHALIAFQKVEGRLPNGRLTRNELKALRSASRPRPREGGYAHIEVDLFRQVLLIADSDGRVSKVLPVSTGNGKEFTSEEWTRRGITPTGRFKVHYKIEGWRKSPLGLIYYPVYFLSGIAIHGYPSVPTRPASHGCIRIPMFAAKEFNEATPIGAWVIVHNGGPADREDVSPPLR